MCVAHYLLVKSKVDCLYFSQAALEKVLKFKFLNEEKEEGNEKREIQRKSLKHRKLWKRLIHSSSTVRFVKSVQSSSQSLSPS